MSSPKIPLRPKNRRYQLTNEEMNCLAWYVISGCKKDEAYKLFVRPDLVTSPMMLKKYADQFYQTTDVRNFLSDYTRTLNGEILEAESRPHPKTREEKRQQATERIEDELIDNINRGGSKTIEELESTAKLADRFGWIGDKKGREETPRRYLALSCWQCTYRFTFEDAVKKGDIVCFCGHCKALKLAQEYGFKYDPKTLLDVPLPYPTSKEELPNNDMSDESN